MAERVDTVVIGGGQAGLAVSYCLTQRRRPHLVLEKRRIGNVWRSERWDSFTLVTPNWTLKLPGFPYAGDDPDGFLQREDIVRYLEAYAGLFDPPVREGVEVTSVRGSEHGLAVESSAGIFEAANVVVAAGFFQKPRLPWFSSQLSPHLFQLHTSQYRNPDQLPPGAVLVVGSGQSGCQIAEELYQAGRQVFLSTGKVGRLPRRYRGRDIMQWAQMIGLFDRTADKLESPEDRFDPNPQATGRDGGHTINLHQFALDGVTLLGRLKDARGSQISLAADLMDNLAMADAFSAEVLKVIDKVIAEHGIDAPPSDEPVLRAGYDCEVITELDLDAAGITSVIWAAGYTFDYSWVKFPVFDEYGYPVQQQGATAQPGLYFVGLPWLHKQKSGLFMGVGEDAEHIAAHIAERG